MKYFYIHGFNSGKNSSSGKAFKKILRETDPLYCLEYDSSSLFKDNLKSLKSQILSLYDNDDFILIGTSLGGFYAERLGLELGGAIHDHIGNILINPCNNPKEQLKKFIGKNVSFETGEEWELTEEILNSYDYEDTRFNRIDRIIVIGTRDTVIDPKSNEDYWDGYGLVSLIFGGEHQIKDFSFLKYDVEVISNTFWS